MLIPITTTIIHHVSHVPRTTSQGTLCLAIRAHTHSWATSHFRIVQLSNACVRIFHQDRYGRLRYSTVFILSKAKCQFLSQYFHNLNTQTELSITLYIPGPNEMIMKISLKFRILCLCVHLYKNSN